MMRVFHVITHLEVGGAERVAFNIAKSDNPAIEYHIVEVVHSFYVFITIEQPKLIRNIRV